MSLYYLTEYNTRCIIYNLLIGENGKIYEGCGLDRALQYARYRKCRGSFTECSVHWYFHKESS